METAKNEDGVRMDGRLHGRDDQGHGVFLLPAVWCCHRSEPSGTTEKILLSGMPIQVEQHPPKTAELEDRAVKGLPDVRQRVFLVKHLVLEKSMANTLKDTRMNNS